MSVAERDLDLVVRLDLKGVIVKTIGPDAEGRKRPGVGKSGRRIRAKRIKARSRKRTKTRRRRRTRNSLSRWRSLRRCKRPEQRKRRLWGRYRPPSSPSSRAD
jgi:hypothetical protein